MKNRIILSVLGLLALFTFGTCKQNKPDKDTDTQDSGEAVFVSDESFAPILDQELYIFKSSYPKAKPTMVYRSENGVVKMLTADSSRFGFLSRDLTTDELAVIKSHNLSAVVKKFAVDAITIIVNDASPDTAITVGEIRLKRIEISFLTIRTQVW